MSTAFQQQLARPSAVALAVGILSHVTFWGHGHHDPNTTAIVGCHILAYSVLVAYSLVNNGFGQSMFGASVVSAAYLTGVFTSMTIYRLFFHRLRNFPGPFMAKVTKLYGPWQSRHMKYHEEHDKLLKKYGDFVRTGPYRSSFGVHSIS